MRVDRRFIHLIPILHERLRKKFGWCDFAGQLLLALAQKRTLTAGPRRDTLPWGNAKYHLSYITNNKEVSITSLLHLEPEPSKNALTMIDPSLRLRRAIHANDPLLCARILKSHRYLLHNPDYSPSGLSNTSLHLASQLGHTSIVSLLLSLGHEDSSTSLNEDHQTALMLASREGHTDVVNIISGGGRGAVERQDIRGRDAVMFAALGGYDTILQILLTFAPEVPKPSAYFPAIPLSAAPTFASVNLSAAFPGTNQIILAGTPAQRALLSHSDIDGNTALHFASSNGHLLALRTLLAAGADPEKPNIWSWTPVTYSATVAAEVYFKNLIAETGVKKVVRAEVERKGTGGGVRLVGKDDADENRPWTVLVDGAWVTMRPGEGPVVMV